ncbi:hypothetical protein DICPUDRAFT_152274 [Dictyostelium purpureum]|uniref:tRNA-dihydrouridine(16/17) synthase [NAD(P)(+)] n=1 Tax=Dictyostelium purpureum TaxID=5786 RepID=F0ZKX6_DICPU|nr:uncharacterized protein DICPUDRAFT_152274 [Dictyostelium purpureum]EGC35390.1 hypothetical protein DICPUDRAFT_152274 [Dictyostelium purpureum]|eukprot:XP_003288066.1 hypothetical protein DICPUDRAFT_152274 [Dictyostelium purpureum]
MTDIEIKENIETTINKEEEEENTETILMNPTTIINKIGGYEFFRNVLKSPKLVVAPMVDHTYLAFRMLTRKYGADLVYTPMFHSKNFVTCKTYRKDNFTTCPEDRPLVVQFCGNDPEWVVKAAKLVEDRCDAIDLNLGCPQQIARRGNYGSFLLDKPHIILPIVRELHKNIKVPIFCKIRLLPDLKDTIKLALDLQEAGCQLLTVHGRTKEQKGQYSGHANWDAIRQIKEVLHIPVIANGSVVKFDDIDRCLEASKADGIMSAEGLLANPSFFCGKDISIYQVAHEYMDFSIQYTTAGHIVRSHLFKMLKEKFDNYSDLRDKMGETHTIDGFRDIVNELENRYKTGAPFIKCLTNKQKRELKEKEDQDKQENEKKQKTENDENLNNNVDNNNNNNSNNTENK